MSDPSVPVADCSCPLAGYCERHRMHKGEVLHRHCRTNIRYRSLWDSRAAGLPPPECLHKLLPGGPGSRLLSTLAKFGFQHEPGCKCVEHAIQMDHEGPAWCRSNLDTILGWLAEQAKLRRLPFSRLIAKTLVCRAIRLSERDSEYHAQRERIRASAGPHVASVASTT